MDLDWLVDKKCSRVASIAQGVFGFEFGDSGINVACAWRIVDNGHIAAAHRDHGQMYGHSSPVDAASRAFELLNGRPVLTGHADDLLGDIRVEFEGSVTLEIFNDSSGFEAWTMTDPNKYVWFAASGGEISGYPGA